MLSTWSVYLPHDVSEIGFILHRKHANQLYLQFDKIAVLEVNVVDDFDVDVLILVDELRVKVPKQHDVPIDNDFASVCLVLFLIWKLFENKQG